MKELESLARTDPKQALKIIRESYYHEAKARARGYWDGFMERALVLLAVIVVVRFLSIHYGLF